MKKKKFMIAGAAVALVVSSFSAGTYASGKLKLIVNGQTASADVQIIKGTTYVPLRAVSEMLGASVNYDNSAETIMINSSGSPAPSSTPNTGSTGTATSKNSRTNPAALGSALPFTVKSFSDDYGGNVSVTQVVRGAQAWHMLHEANPFNSEPKAGYEYLLAKATVSISRNAQEDAAVDFSRVSFTLVSTTGTAYDMSMGVSPEPDIDTSLYEGSSHEGWIVFQVKKNDESPVIAFERNYDGTGGVWFKTN
ncbi:hypothetical protein CDO73_03585 [Saccharibacillus sp. O23]|uniref:DUF4352 domain-containing protein n=1 Tax=Saccharibacillus sp. O23 TaxID=2009338 RepID=UPI000B4E3780|nr:stalk domain-containing protein [Saccharibacillus sp. O23]OWR32694.1 hypothetical protein CDO73_03585 [Saccharibacillus sp. O23]